MAGLYSQLPRWKSSPGRKAERSGKAECPLSLEHQLKEERAGVWWRESDSLTWVCYPVPVVGLGMEDAASPGRSPHLSILVSEERMPQGQVDQPGLRGAARVEDGR